ncbi:hypothetical protein EG329_002408 [Mollisiaceae sp. DMI_Dod_QoI]|nr:hypothetical protein EG329_002408 [Helotiales sp. DMI_Dod_QoI]
MTLEQLAARNALQFCTVATAQDRTVDTGQEEEEEEEEEGGAASRGSPETLNLEDLSGWHDLGARGRRVVAVEGRGESGTLLHNEVVEAAPQLDRPGRLCSAQLGEAPSTKHQAPSILNTS